MQPSFEIFDHTADMGIRVRAATLPELLQPAAEALYSIIGELATCGETQPVTLDLTGADCADLLRDFLAELLVIFEQDRRCMTSLAISVFDDYHLNVIVHTRLTDRARSIYHREVKAITYHELKVRTIPGGFEATIIVDI